MSIRYDLPRGQFFDEKQRYVNPATVAEKLEQAEADLKALQARYGADYEAWEEAARKAEALLIAEQDATIAELEAMLRLAAADLYEARAGNIAVDTDDWIADLRRRCREES